MKLALLFLALTGCAAIPPDYGCGQPGGYFFFWTQCK
jgi:hypothetical protein